MYFSLRQLTNKNNIVSLYVRTFHSWSKKSKFWSKFYEQFRKKLSAQCSDRKISNKKFFFVIEIFCSKKKNLFENFRSENCADFFFRNCSYNFGQNFNFFDHEWNVRTYKLNLKYNFYLCFTLKYVIPR